MINPDQVTPIVVTRGDISIERVIRSLHARWDGVFRNVLLRDNSQSETDLSVYGRYEIIKNVNTPAVYVQDDDFVLPRDSLVRLLEAYEPGRIVANMPQRFRSRYTDSCLVGMGAIFDRDLPASALNRFLNENKTEFAEQTFLRTCDVIFTTLTPFTLVDLPVEATEWTYAANRMYRQATHTSERARALALARAVRDSRR